MNTDMHLSDHAYPQHGASLVENGVMTETFNRLRNGELLEVRRDIQMVEEA